ncbi:Oxidoreductase htatip2 [Dimargaris verticillata]|uniref:Oxidoreductase htatip2 n=1 Tax=Dimargaris verticillata TaxID=2761393 RepID=A0A9W8B9L3_9FUNG|nr:Oxidoreductase htatip2 [Dimargaris verticillata]
MSTPDASSDGAAAIIAAAANKFKEAYSAQSITPRALIVGASGETGQQVLRELLSSGAFAQVTSVGRREVTYGGPNGDRLVQKVVDFEQLCNEHGIERKGAPNATAAPATGTTTASKVDFQGHTHAYCCLGTTRAKSGVDGFYRVDHDYTMAFAKAFYEANAPTAPTAATASNNAEANDVADSSSPTGDSPTTPLQFSVVSSTGANARSPLLYVQTKGQVEEELKAMPFTRLTIFRPAGLLCDRKESRFMETVMVKAIRSIDRIFGTKSLGISTALLGQAIVLDSLRHPLAKANAAQKQQTTLSNAAILDSLKTPPAV